MLQQIPGFTYNRKDLDGKMTRVTLRDTIPSLDTIVQILIEGSSAIPY